jgi:hypothetical protein
MDSSVGVQVSVIKNFKLQKTNIKQITMTKIPNDWILILFEIWILRFGIYLLFGACNLLFPVYPGNQRSLR